LISVKKGEVGTGSSPACGRIGINAHLLAQEEGYRRAGVSRYIDNLLIHVLRNDPGGDYTVFLNSRCGLSLCCNQKCSRLPTYRPLVRIFWEQFLQPLELVAENVALLHSPVNVQPLFLPCKGVVTVTDLSFMAFPESFRAFQRFYQSILTRLSVRRASRVIAISASTAQDVTRFFGVPADRISVTYPGVDAAYQPVQDQSGLVEFRHLHDLPERFILFVGTLEPRKNVLMLLQAYAKFRQQTRNDFKLVLGGGVGWLYQAIFAAVEELALKDDVILPGYIPEDELPLWYNAADVFAYPSLYEGFGLPPLEAMACGTPVIVSDASSLPEVVGDAAVLVNPHEPDEWAAALSLLCHDADLRADLASRGIERAQEFSWTRMARETIKVYRHVLSLPKGRVLSPPKEDVLSGGE
jgi:glycosyltransferase involved in cell wall biosynthesis